MADQVYYSVSAFGTGDIKTGSPTLTISSGVATLSVAQTGNIGIGCRITYDTSSVAYISAVNSSTSFDIVTAVGGTPSDEGSSVTVNSIAHEYADIEAFNSGYTDSNHINNTSLVSADVQVTACVYYDHVDNDPITGDQNISGATDDATRYVRVYSPRGGTESINNQQSEDGVFDTDRAYFDFAINQNFVNSQAYTRIEGLQLRTDNDAFSQDLFANGHFGGASSDVMLLKSIFTGSDAGKSCVATYGGNLLIEDCSIYNPTSGSGVLSQYAYSSPSTTVKTTTVYGCNNGIYRTGGTMTVTNCALFNNTDDINGTATVSYTASEDGDGTNATTITQTANDYEDLVVDAANDDFNVKDASSELYDNGTATGRSASDIASRTWGTDDCGAFALEAASGNTITSDQDEAGDTQVASVQTLVSVSADQDEAGDTQVASITGTVFANITANQNEAGDTQVASVQTVVQITADQDEAGDTQAAALGVVVSVSADQDEAGDTQVAGINATGEARITADQDEAGDTQLGNISVTVQITADQDEAGDTQVADINPIVQITADQDEAGDTQVASVRTQETPIINDFTAGVLNVINDLYGVSNVVTADGLGVVNTVNADGLGVVNTISSSFGVQSSISDDGLGKENEI